LYHLGLVMKKLVMKNQNHILKTNIFYWLINNGSMEV